MKYLLLLICLLNVSCATLESKSTITVKDNKVTFDSARPVKMTMKNGEIEYTYDRQSESWASKMISMFTLGLVGSRR